MMTCLLSADPNAQSEVFKVVSGASTITISNLVYTWCKNDDVAKFAEVWAQ